MSECLKSCSLLPSFTAAVVKCVSSAVLSLRDRCVLIDRMCRYSVSFLRLRSCIAKGFLQSLVPHCEDTDLLVILKAVSPNLKSVAERIAALKWLCAILDEYAAEHPVEAFPDADGIWRVVRAWERASQGHSPRVMWFFSHAKNAYLARGVYLDDSVTSGFS